VCRTSKPITASARCSRSAVAPAITCAAVGLPRRRQTFPPQLRSKPVGETRRAPVAWPIPCRDDQRTLDAALAQMVADHLAAARKMNRRWKGESLDAIVLAVVRIQSIFTQRNSRTSLGHATALSPAASPRSESWIQRQQRQLRMPQAQRAADQLAALRYQVRRECIESIRPVSVRVRPPLNVPAPVPS